MAKIILRVGCITMCATASRLEAADQDSELCVSLCLLLTWKRFAKFLAHPPNARVNQAKVNSGKVFGDV